MQGCHGAAEGAGHLDERLGGLDLDDRLVHGHGVASGHQPPDDVGLGQALSQVREQEGADGHVSPPTAGRPRRPGCGPPRAGNGAPASAPDRGCRSR
ncbi:hypothetical protein ACFFX0_21525 [Citricoccus parietis]|uniref:Uncharacterized protein n=1 Tax=Citricoccus parietis TaxID=592307 RepID=A0ABV5G3X9_9MICC